MLLRSLAQVIAGKGSRHRRSWIHPKRRGAVCRRSGATVPGEVECGRGGMGGEAADLGAGTERNVVALWIGARDPRTPVLAKIAAAAVAAYALSPIDLIPDFIPVLGYLDDVILVPITSPPRKLLSLPHRLSFGKQIASVE